MASPVRDKDLLSIQQARSLAAAAREAQKALKEFSQEQVDRIVEAMAGAARGEAERLAKLAHEETGFGNTKDKTLRTSSRPSTSSNTSGPCARWGSCARTRSGASSRSPSRWAWWRP